MKPAALLILFDTGGVRLQEANAGETAIAETMRAIDPAAFVTEDGLEARVTVPGDVAGDAELLRRLVELGLPVVEFGPAGEGLQDAYLALLKRNGDAA